MKGKFGLHFTIVDTLSVQWRKEGETEQNVGFRVSHVVWQLRGGRAADLFGGQFATGTSEESSCPPEFRRGSSWGKACQPHIMTQFTLGDHQHQHLRLLLLQCKGFQRRRWGPKTDRTQLNCRELNSACCFVRGLIRLDAEEFSQWCKLSNFNMICHWISQLIQDLYLTFFSAFTATCIDWKSLMLCVSTARLSFTPTVLENRGNTYPPECSGLLWTVARALESSTLTRTYSICSRVHGAVFCCQFVVQVQPVEFRDYKRMKILYRMEVNCRTSNSVPFAAFELPEEANEASAILCL